MYIHTYTHIHLHIHSHTVVFDYSTPTISGPQSPKAPPMPNKTEQPLKMKSNECECMCEWVCEYEYKYECMRVCMSMCACARESSVALNVWVLINNRITNNIRAMQIKLGERKSKRERERERVSLSERLKLVETHSFSAVNSFVNSDSDSDSGKRVCAREGTAQFWVCLPCALRAEAVVVVVVSGDEHVRAINSDLSERQSKSESERVRLVVALYSTVLEYVHRRVSLSLCCSGSFGLANRATMLLARVNGEQEISLQLVAQVWVTHIVSTERVACFVIENKLYVKWESPDKKKQQT